MVGSLRVLLVVCDNAPYISSSNRWLREFVYEIVTTLFILQIYSVSIFIFVQVTVTSFQETVLFFVCQERISEIKITYLLSERNIEQSLKCFLQFVEQVKYIGLRYS